MEAEFEAALPGRQSVFVYGTERPIRRAKDYETQRANYSGKRKRHTKKNLVVSDERKQVLILSRLPWAKSTITPHLKADSAVVQAMLGLTNVSGSLEAVLKMSRAPAEQGARRRRTAVYMGVHEDCEPPRNAAMASAAIFKTASYSRRSSRTYLLCR